MKIRLLGVLLILVGFISIAVGISFISEATGENIKQNTAIDETGKNVEILAGTYYLGGDISGEKIEIFSDDTFEMTGFARQPYTVKVWKDMATTDEQTGVITLKDFYFLGTNLDGGTKYADKIGYDYENLSLEYKTKTYKLVK